MPVTITLTRDAFNKKRTQMSNNFHVWVNDRLPIQNPGSTMLCTSADTKGFLQEGLVNRRNYTHYLHEYQQANVPMFLTSQRAFDDVRAEIMNFARTPVLTVTNGGSVAYDSLGHEICDKRFSLTSAKALNDVLTKIQEGVVCVGTKQGTFSDIKSSSLKTSLDPFLMTTFHQQKFRQAFSPCGNVSGSLGQTNPQSYITNMNFGWSTMEKHRF